MSMTRYARPFGAAPRGVSRKRLLSPIDQPAAVTALQRSLSDARQTLNRFSDDIETDLLLLQLLGDGGRRGMIGEHAVDQAQ